MSLFSDDPSLYKVDKKSTQRKGQEQGLTEAGEVGTGLGQARRDFIWTTRKEENGGREAGPDGTGEWLRQLCDAPGKASI